MNPNNEIRQQLIEQLDQQIQIYGAAIPVAELLSQNYDLGGASQDDLARLQEMLSHTAAHDEKIIALRTSLEVTGISLDTAVTERAKKLADQIKQLMDLFDVISNRASTARDRMLPKVSESLQARKMQSAYSPDPGQ